jgi:hypothetical protein
MPITINLTDEQRTNLLTSAIEGGSNYWYMFEEHAGNLINSVPELPTTKESCFDGTFVWKLWSALKAGLEIPVHDIETSEEIGKLSMNSIEQGEQTMSEKYAYDLAEILQQNYDASTADAWFQLAVMNEIIYG